MQRPEIVKHPHLDERTVQFGMLAMWVCEQLPQGYAGRNIADQLFRSGTAVAANYAEGCEPESDADFVHKLKVAMKELKETRVWLRYADAMTRNPFIAEIVKESFEVLNMLGASVKSLGRSRWRQTDH